MKKTIFSVLSLLVLFSFIFANDIHSKAVATTINPEDDICYNPEADMVYMYDDSLQIYYYFDELSDTYYCFDENTFTLFNATSLSSISSEYLEKLRTNFFTVDNSR